MTDLELIDALLGSEPSPPILQATDWKSHLILLSESEKITLKSVAKLFSSQKGMCAISGLKMSFLQADLCCAVLLREGSDWVIVCRWVKDAGGIELRPIIERLINAHPVQSPDNTT